MKVIPAYLPVPLMSSQGNRFCNTDVCFSRRQRVRRFSPTAGQQLRGCHAFRPRLKPLSCYNLDCKDIHGPLNGAKLHVTAILQ